MIPLRLMIRHLTLLWLLLVVLSGMAGAVMLSGSYQLRPLDKTLDQMLRRAIQERGDSSRPGDEFIAAEAVAPA